MIFSSIFFMFVFLPVTLLLYFLVPGKVKNLVLLLCSLVFYAWGEPVYIFLMMFSILFNYISGIELERHRQKQEEGKLRLCFWTTVAANLAILGFFKYYGFFILNLNKILPFDIPYKELALPIGTSFYPLQTLSYIIDVYRGKVEVQKNLIYFGTYVTMFPQLIAGPIVRYADVEKQLRSRNINIAKFGDGVLWFLRGLGKKVLLANNIGMVFDTILAMGAGERSVLTAWVGCLAYTMQIYYDFSGYSDMAIGLGKMFGFEFMKNFEYPYISKSITEFWRRWHISLGTWFREYVYIPLGGNRVTVPKHIRNILVVWMLTGFWHGAAWNFMFWGLYYGLLLLVEKYFLHALLEKAPAVFSHIYTMLLVMVGWVFFFAPSMGQAFTYLGNMVGIGGNGLVDGAGIYYLTTNLVLFLIMALCATPKVYELFRHFTLADNSVFRLVGTILVYLVIFAASTAYLVNVTYNPFLYFRF